MERQAEQSTLAQAAGDESARDIKERRRRQRAVPEDPDAAGLLDNEEPLAAVIR
jgi:hypothetical protein